MSFDAILSVIGLAGVAIGGFWHLSARLAVIETKVDLMFKWWQENSK